MYGNMKATIGWRFQRQWLPQRDGDCEQILHLFRKERIMRKKSRSEIRVKQGSGCRLCPLSKRIGRREKPFLELKGHGLFLFKKNWFSTVLTARLPQAKTASDLSLPLSVVTN